MKTSGELYVEDGKTDEDDGETGMYSVVDITKSLSLSPTDN